MIFLSDSLSVHPSPLQARCNLPAPLTPLHTGVSPQKLKGDSRPSVLLIFLTQDRLPLPHLKLKTLCLAGIP